ncbi:MAG: cupredoxin domain-containing protein [Patescibacteria group bacterium]
MQKDTKTALIFCGVFVGLFVFGFILRGNVGGVSTAGGSVVENGRQIIDIAAKGGYTPNVIEAQAGIPTDLRVFTNGTYDCSSSIVIPSLGYQEMLQATGTETISLTAEQAQGTLEGMCSMGMYRFEIAFK